MNTTDFIYWLKGFLETEHGKGLTPEQVQTIKARLVDVHPPIPYPQQPYVRPVPMPTWPQPYFNRPNYTGDPFPGQYPSITCHMLYKEPTS
jgi:hypothetical protein